MLGAATCCGSIPHPDRALDVLLLNGTTAEEKIFVSTAPYLMHELLTGCQDIISAKWCHTDLHPNNIMVAWNPVKDRWELRIIDLGNKAALGSKSRYTKSRNGKPQIAPELYRGTGRHTESSEVFSICYLITNFFPALSDMTWRQLVASGCDSNPLTRPSLKTLKSRLERILKDWRL